MQYKFIDFKTTQAEIDRINQFLIQYENENFSTLIKKTIRKIYRLLILENITAKLSEVEPLQAGNVKTSSARIPASLADLLESMCFKLRMNRSAFLRAGIAYYMEHSKPEQERKLDLENVNCIIEEVE